MTETVDNETRAFIEAAQLLEDAGWVVLRPDSKLLRRSDTRIEGGGYIDPETDQYVGPFTRCICGNKRLALKGKFWCCTKCGVSWGENAGPSESAAPPVNKSPTPEHVEGDVLSVGEMEALARRLRDYRPPALDPAHGREHHPICDEAADALTSATTRIQRVERERDEAREEIKSHELSFDLRWKSDMRAIGRWQAETGRTKTLPDHTDLSMWLFKKLEAAEAQLADAVKVLEPFASRVALPKDLESAMRAARAFLSTIGEKPDAE